jgi:nucleoside-diphosphate-sugar epimerase
MSKLVLGCGYLGERVARLWRAAGESVSVVTRSASRAKELRVAGYVPIVADVSKPETLRELPAADEILYAIGYDRKADASRQAVQIDGLHAALDATWAACRQKGIPPQRTKLVLISTTGVYGQTDGAWIDEDSPCEPLTESGRACLAAEQVLCAHSWGSRSVILRLAGIYGPGRLPRLDSLQRGEPIAANGDSYLNLIHVDDAASIVLAAFAGAVAPALYLVSDGHPVQRSDYYAELARQIGAPPPQLIGSDPARAALERGNTDKRIAANRLFADLEIRLQYPDFRPGIAASLPQ